MAALKFRVLLDNADEKEIFRDILIDEKENFETFYKYILKSFNFEGLQLGSFYVSDDSWDKGNEITLTDMSFGDDMEENTRIMKETTISETIENADQRYILVYDFMRMWIFLVELIERTQEMITAPSTVFSSGMAPPEDSKDMDGLNFGGEVEPGMEEDFDEDDDMMSGYNDFEEGYEDDNGY